MTREYQVIIALLDRFPVYWKNGTKKQLIYLDSLTKI